MSALNSIFINSEILPYGMFSANPVGASVLNPGSFLEGRVIDQPYMKHKAAIAIHNGKGSGVKLNVKLMNLHAINRAQTATASIKLSRITAYTGGVELTPDKMDSGNSDLPAQFKFIQNAYTVTETASTIIRQAMTMTWASLTTALAYLVSQSNGDARSKMDSSEFIRSTGDVDCQSHRLREGEGVSFIANTNSSYHCYALTFMVRNISTNECYRLNSTILPTVFSGKPVLSVFNGSGSGVVMAIERVQIREIGTFDQGIADYSRIDGIDDYDIQYPEYILADTSGSLPSQVKVRKNAFCAMAGSKVGALSTQPYFRRVSLTESPYGPGITSGPDLRKGKYTRDLQCNADNCIVLNEGEGIGLFIRNPSALFYYDFSAVIDIEDASTPSGGATSFAF